MLSQEINMDQGAGIEREQSRPRSKTAEIIRQNYEAIKSLLIQDPFLTYQAENEQAYQVSQGPGLFLLVPKNRQAPEPYPPADPLRPAFRWLGWAFLGLAPAGLGTVIFAPLAAIYALRVYRSPALKPADRSRAFIALALAVGLWSLALILTLLFVFQWV